jgi:hypothetical protein
MHCEKRKLRNIPILKGSRMGRRVNKEHWTKKTEESSQKKGSRGKQFYSSLCRISTTGLIPTPTSLWVGYVILISKLLRLSPHLCKGYHPCPPKSSFYDPFKRILLLCCLLVSCCPKDKILNELKVLNIIYSSMLSSLLKQGV